MYSTINKRRIFFINQKDLLKNVQAPLTHTNIQQTVDLAALANTTNKILLRISQIVQVTAYL